MSIRTILLAWLVAVTLAMSCAQGTSPDAETSAASSAATTGSGAAAGSGGGTASSGAQGSGGMGGGTGNPCAGITCNMPPANACADTTNLTVYEPTGTCNQGQCEYATSLVPCPNGCAGGACIGDPCIGVSCMSPPANYCLDATYLTVYESPGACNAGSCAYGSHQEFCQNGCAGGACTGDPCVGVTCNMPPAKYCSGPNDLTVFDVPGTCMGGTCQYESHTEFCSFGCVNGACMGDPCVGVTCTTPPASYCSGANTLRVYDAVGSCLNGACAYAYMEQTCPGGCSNGICVECAVTSDCPSGEWCNNATCQPCNDSQHCGPSCANCTLTGDVCNASGTACVDCVMDAQCPGGNYCNTGTCAPCNTAQHCGPACVACSGTTPTCSGTACVCSGSSCGAYYQCISGACAQCNTDSACGSACTACSAPTPKCLDEGTTSKCVQCLTSSDCTSPNTCTANVCGAGCPLPTDSCATGSQSRLGCTNARIIGRSVAGTSSGYTASPTLCTSSNNMDSASCNDSGNDHTYRVFLRQGETMTVTLSTGAECLGSTWFATLKFMTNAGCSSTACSTIALCQASISNTTKSHVATQDGWHIIVVDGSSGQSGVYTMNVKITCNSPNCEC